MRRRGVSCLRLRTAAHGRVNERPDCRGYGALPAAMDALLFTWPDEAVLGPAVRVLWVSASYNYRRVGKAGFRES